MASLKEVGERQLIANIRKVIRPATGVRGTEDDAALLKLSGELAATTDSVTFERHRPKGMTFEQFGWTAAAVNFSDLAAMGARPSGLLVSLALPQDLDESAVYDIVSGIDQCAEFCKTKVIGGDTKPGPGVIACTALGDMEGRKAMMRSGADIGDVVAVTGCLGGPAAGFKAIEAGIDAEDAIYSLMTPVPRVSEGIKLAATGKVTSCIDLSDGLGTAANTVCQQSHVGMELIQEFLPEGPDVEYVSERTGTPIDDLLIGWGGEYELLFTFAKEDIDALHKAGVLFSIIGLVTNDDGVYLREGDARRKVDYGSY
jgi:thiamine-monophosphate kinase